MIIPSLGEFVVVVVEDHCGGRTLGAGTHVYIETSPVQRGEPRPY